MSEEEIKKVINEKCFYVIKDLIYLKIDEEKEKVEKRFWERLGEKVYVLVYNNCEYLVKYILIGNLIFE